MTDEAHSASHFPADPGTTGSQENDMSLVLPTTQDFPDEYGFSTIPRSSAKKASQKTFARLGSAANPAPDGFTDSVGIIPSTDAEVGMLCGKIAVLEKTKSNLLAQNAALAGSVDSRDSEIRRLNATILALEKAKSDLLAENAALVKGVDASDAKSRTLTDKLVAAEQAKADLLVENAAFVKSVDARDAEYRTLADKLVAVEQAQAKLLNENVALVRGVDSKTTESTILSDRLIVLEQARSELFFENTTLAGDMDSSKARTQALHEEIADLEHARSDLLARNAVLVGDVDSANARTQALQRELAVLESAKSDLIGRNAALAGGVDSRDAEIKRLNDSIVILEQAKSDLLTENAALASALMVSKPVAAQIPEVSEEVGPFANPRAFMDAANQNPSNKTRSLTQVAQAVPYEFTGGVDSDKSDTGRPNNEVVVFDAGKSDLLVKNAMLANALRASQRKSNFAKLLIALGGSLAGFGLHLIGTHIDSRQTGITVMAIGIGLGLMNLGWFFRPKEE